MTTTQPNDYVTLCVDLKKYRIRIHRATLSRLGSPKYIQLLVNPDKRTVAIKASDTDTYDDQTHTVYRRIIASDNSYEIYSKVFIEKLCSIMGNLDRKGSYRISGKLIATQKAAIFSMDTLKPIVAGGNNDV